MANETYQINVVVDTSNAERGTRRVRNELSGTEKVAANLSKILIGLFAVERVITYTRQIGRLSQQYIELQNRLRVVVNSERELAEVTEELLDLSRETRSSLQSTVALYSRLSLASRELGLTQEETLQFTKSLNQAIIISGATAQEASAGLIQLSQGLASGTLRGDELRSVLEQLPVVADVIAKGLGVTRGELRELGAAGVISADQVIKAFQDAEQELDEGFAKTVPTVTQSVQAFNDEFLVTVGLFDEISGISESTASFFQSLTAQFNVFRENLAAVAVAEGFLERTTEEINKGFEDQADAVEQVSRQVQIYVDFIDKESEIFKLNNREREIQLQILKIERQLKRDLNTVEEEALRLAFERRNQLKDQTALLEDINASVTNYTETLRTLNELEAQGLITAQERARVLSETELGRDFGALSDQLNIGAEGIFAGVAEEEIALQDQLLERQRLLEEAAQAEIITEREKARLLLEIQEDYNNQSRQLELERARVTVQTAQGISADLISITRDLGGEQTKAFRALFAINKAFAIADATIKIQQAIASGAASLPFPANLGAIGTIIAATSSILSTIRSTEPQGFANGGQFMVNGTGGTDSQLVQFMASPNERVTVETPEQQRNRDFGQNTENMIVQPSSPTIVNVLDPNLLGDYLATPDGEEVIVNVIERNATSINSVLNP